MKKSLKNLFLFVFIVFFAVTPIHSQPKFSFKLVGGFSTMGGGDLNDAISEYNKYYADYAALGYSTSFDLDELRWIPNFKGELIFHLSSNLGIGIGTEYLSKTNKGAGQKNYSAVTYYPNETYSYEFNTKDDFSVLMKATPITLNLYYFFPIGRKITVFLNAGGAYYFASFEQTNVYVHYTEYAREITFDLDTITTFRDSGTVKENAKAESFGVQGGLGLEFDITSTIALVAEISGRVVNFKDWTGDLSDEWSWENTYWLETVGTEYDRGSERVIEIGKLWCYSSRDYNTNKSYKTIGIREGWAHSPGREAEIDLSGFQFRIGIRIKI